MFQTMTLPSKTKLIDHETAETFIWQSLN